MMRAPVARSLFSDVAAPLAVEPEAALARSVEDLLGALAAGLAQHVPPAAEVEAAPPEIQSGDDADADTARRTVAEALAAIAAAGGHGSLQPDAATASPLADAINDNDDALADIAEDETLVADASPSVTSTIAATPTAVEPDAGIAEVVQPTPETGVTPAEAISDPAPNAIAAAVVEPLAKPAAEPQTEADIDNSATTPAVVLAALAPAAMAATVQPSAPVDAVAREATVTEPSPAASRTFEDTVTIMLRPLIKDWLDRNMPGMVEKALEAELKARQTPPERS